MPDGAPGAELSAAQDAWPPLQHDGGRRRRHVGVRRGTRPRTLRRRGVHRLLRAGLRGVGAGVRHPRLHLPRLRDQANRAAVADSLAHFRHQGRRDLPRLHRAGPVGTAGGVHGQPGVGDTRGVRHARRTQPEPGRHPHVPRGVHRRLEHFRPLPRRAAAAHLLCANHDVREPGIRPSSCRSAVLHDLARRRHPLRRAGPADRRRAPAVPAAGTASRASTTPNSRTRPR